MGIQKGGEQAESSSQGPRHRRQRLLATERLEIWILCFLRILCFLTDAAEDAKRSGSLTKRGLERTGVAAGASVTRTAMWGQEDVRSKQLWVRGMGVDPGAPAPIA